MNKINFSFFILFSITLFSCSISKELKEERKQWRYKNWNQYYKDRAFCLCFYEGFENKKMEDMLLKYDKSFFDALGIAIFDESLRPFLKPEIESIRLDSVKSYKQYPEDLHNIYLKRNVFNHCLEFYKSRRLDQKVKIEKRNWQKIPNIMNRIHEKIPTY